jgi:hypothetical protein
MDDPGFESRQGQFIFLFFSKTPRHQRSCSVGTRVSSQVLERQGRDDDRSPPLSVEVKNEWSYTSPPPLQLHCVEKDNFTSEAKRCKRSRKSDMSC